jgi:hypothetical protein
MSSNEIIERLVVDASTDPLNPEKNFAVAVEYEKLNQTASAVGFYLRAAEYGYESHPSIAYASLLRISICIEGQKDRNWSVSNVILQAIAYLPARPEAYFLMSRFYERSTQWQECYAFACMGLMFSNQEFLPLPTFVDYEGEYCLLFEKAVSAWWIGRKDESLKILNELKDREDISMTYKVAIMRNLANI